MAKLLAALALMGAASYSWGSALSDQSTCGHTDDAACKAGDHSLLQVVSHPSSHGRERARGTHVHKRIPASGKRRSTKKKQPAELLESRGASHTRSRESAPEVNRTIANITKAINGELHDLEDFANLLVLGRHKLCAAHDKNAIRVETLMHLLKAQNLLQVGAIEAPEKDGHSLEEAQKADRGQWFESVWGDSGSETAQNVVDEVKSWWEPAPPKEQDPVVEKVVDITTTPKPMDNRTLSNITADLGTEVGDVERIMSDIQAEGDRLEVISTETSDRAKILLSSLATETQQCENGGEYSYGGLLQAGTQSHDPTQTVKENQKSTLQAATAQAEQRFTKAEMQKYLKPAIEANQSITYWDLTETIKNITSQLETDVNALILEKNKLSVAGAEGVSHLDNLEDTMSGQHGGPGSAKVQLALQIRQTVNAHTAPALDAESDNENSSDTSKAPVALTNASTSATIGNATTMTQLQASNVEVKEDNATLTAALQAAEIERLKSEINKKELAQTQVTQQQVLESSQAKFDVPDVGDVAIGNLGFGVDKQVVNLEADVSILGEQKHEVCWVTKDVLEHLQKIVTILAAVPC